MRSDEEVLVKNLTARLSEEISNLPRDGQGHPLTVKIKGNRGQINLGHHTHLCKGCHHNWRHHRPAAASAKKRTCNPSSHTQLITIVVVCLGVALLSFFVRDLMSGT
jgi:hypothetical protein